MKINKNGILALSLAFLMVLPTIALTMPLAKADAEAEGPQKLPVEHGPWGVWYKFETSLMTLIFPSGGKKPMFLWWYTNDNSTIYVVKFQGIIEYLTFDLQHYDRRYQANSTIIQHIIEKRFVEPKMGRLKQNVREQVRQAIISKLIAKLLGLHSPYLSFSSGNWTLEGPMPVTNVTSGDVSYWSFNFTLTNVSRPEFKFSENNIQIRCRFYAATTTETPDPEHSYTVAAGQLKFDFVISHWEWNMDKLQSFVDWLNENHRDLNITIPTYKTGLALWINLASIKVEDLASAKNDVQGQYQETVETKSKMQGAAINDEYCPVSANKTKNEYERQIQVTSRFKNRTRIQYANKEENVSGFLEFVPWARLLNETGDTVDYVNVTASYIAAGAHLRLFICYPYFGNYTLEHDPTIGIASAPLIPMLITPTFMAILIGATIVIAIAVVVVRLRKKPINIVGIR